MHETTNNYDEKLARDFILDELFDLSLYTKLKTFSNENTQNLLEQLIEIEKEHFSFWQNFFNIQLPKLNLARKIKMYAVILFCRVFREAGIHLVLEAVEVYGIRKYLNVWEHYKNDPLSASVRKILLDEFEHEDKIVMSAVRRKIHPERIRDIFLGFNDGLVEILGAVSGFFAAFQMASSVLIASFTVAVAGSISMAAGAFVAMGAEIEVKDSAREKRRFLGEEYTVENHVKPLSSAVFVGVSYFIGALIPVLPVFFGSQNIVASIIISGVMIIIVSYFLAFLSGMDAKKRILTNIVILAIAVSVTYAIGSVATTLLGVSL